MEANYEEIKKNLPMGWQKKIADTGGCSPITVTNVLGRRSDKNMKSRYAIDVLSCAIKMAEEHKKAIDKISNQAKSL